MGAHPRSAHRRHPRGGRPLVDRDQGAPRRRRDRLIGPEAPRCPGFLVLDVHRGDLGAGRPHARPCDALVAVILAVVALVQVPYLDWGWWTALGGLGNPVTGGTERTTGTPLEWIVPVVFLLLLVPALPLFAEAEEKMFRLGAERRSRWGRFRRSVEF